MFPDFRPVLLITGTLIAVLGAAMVVPAIVDYAAGRPDWLAFLVSGLITSTTGTGLFLSARGLRLGLNTRQAFLMTATSWIALSTFAALPFYLSGSLETYTDAFFEAMSGLTTTGATVITDLDLVSPGILLWRGILQWLGGLGIVVMAVAVLPMLQVGGMQVFKVEAFDTPEKILPRATQISGSITLVFVAITASCVLAYLLAGMQLLDAFVHAMATVSTGGFSTKNGSIGEFGNPAVEYITVFYMIVGSIPFLLYVQVVQGRVFALFRDRQVHAFLLTLWASIVVIWVMERVSDSNSGIESLRLALFNVTSIMTGTGYVSTDYSNWGTAVNVAFFFIMFIGGCAGSTSCGIKIFRFQVLFQDIRQHMNRIVYPNGVFMKKFCGRPLSDTVSAAVMSFLFLYFLTFAIASVGLSLTGLDPLTALSGAGSAISNVGPGLGNIIGPVGNYEPLGITAKWILSLTMLIGRLELFTIFVLFVPTFWRR